MAACGTPESSRNGSNMSGFCGKAAVPLTLLIKTTLALCAATIDAACVPVGICRPTGRSIMQQAHTKAAEHHENAAKSHRSAAESHGKNDHTKGKEHANQAQQHAENASEHSKTAQAKSAQQK
jgi:hypothetical protein